jgi:hypothetical protein
MCRWKNGIFLALLHGKTRKNVLWFTGRDHVFRLSFQPSGAEFAAEFLSQEVAQREILELERD